MQTDFQKTLAESIKKRQELYGISHEPPRVVAARRKVDAALVVIDEAMSEMAVEANAYAADEELRAKYAKLEAEHASLKAIVRAHLTRKLRFTKAERDALLEAVTETP